jgi:hypothetical protein
VHAQAVMVVLGCQCVVLSVAVMEKEGRRPTLFIQGNLSSRRGSEITLSTLIRIRSHPKLYSLLRIMQYYSVSSRALVSSGVRRCNILGLD